ncbi:MAG: MarR family transcriptional regulator [Bacteroidales bacterium]|nr:MarR family transcriptional regulator [Bacteroidales bacterium]
MNPKRSDSRFDPQSNEMAVLSIILEFPSISKNEIAKRISVSRPTISRVLNSLRKQYNIEWVGASRKGYWSVSKK